MMDERLSKAVRVWSRAERIWSAQFAKETRLSLAYSRAVLAGSRPVGEKTLERIAEGFGPGAVAEIYVMRRR
jgi:hypothetical protein